MNNFTSQSIRLFIFLVYVVCRLRLFRWVISVGLVYWLLIKGRTFIFRDSISLWINTLGSIKWTLYQPQKNFVGSNWSSICKPHPNYFNWDNELEKREHESDHIIAIVFSLKQMWVKWYVSITLTNYFYASLLLIRAKTSAIPTNFTFKLKT